MCQLILKGLKWIKHFFVGKVMNHSNTFSIVDVFFWKPVQKSKEINKSEKSQIGQ